MALVWILVTVIASAQTSELRPTFAADHVLPSGRSRPSSLAPGMLVSIYGEHLGPPQSCQGPADPIRKETPNPARPRQMFGELLIYPVTLCEVRVNIAGVPAGLLYVSEKQINFKVPQPVPLDGMADVRVVHQGRMSDPVAVKLGLHFATLALQEPAYVGMPVWLDVEMPMGWGSIRYPIHLVPDDLGCADVEVRRLGQPLPRLRPLNTATVANGPGPCGFIGLPSEPKKQGRIPLHLLFSFIEPGTYEVKFTGRRGGFGNGPSEIIADSEWTTIEIQPAVKNQRELWIAHMSAAHPSDAVDLLSDYLPSILGVPDDASLAIVEQDLYHPNELVRRYVSNALGYWPSAKIAETMAQLMRDRGPSDQMAEYFSRSPQGPRDVVFAMIRSTLGYLQSDSPVSLRGAVTLLSRLAMQPNSLVTAGLRSEVEAAMLAAADHVIQLADQQTITDFVASLGQFHDIRAHELLWKLAEENVARGQALIAITWRNDPSDLPRLGQLLLGQGNELSSLPYALHRSYGDAAIPYLETALRDSRETFVRTNCARELMIIGRPAGFAFAADAIENNRSYRREMMGFLRDQFTEARALDENALLRYVEKRKQ